MMKRNSVLITLITIFAVLFLAGCKQNVGSPEDNAVVEESEEQDMCLDSADRICPIRSMKYSKIQ